MTNVKKLKPDTPEVQEKKTQHNLTITLTEYDYDHYDENSKEMVLKKIEFKNIRGFQVGVNVMQVLREEGTTFLIPVSRIYQVEDSFVEVI